MDIPVDNSSSTNNSDTSGRLPLSSSPYRIALICIYTVILLVGSLGIALMINVLKSNLRSVTTVAVLNLIFAHLLFLPTIPFRIDYYVRDSWELPDGLCKIVSAMVHIHMYISFLIYVAVLIFRFLQFYKRTERQEFHRRLHSLGVSVAVWSVVLIIVPPVLLNSYGDSQEGDSKICFKFGSKIRSAGVSELNYIISSIFVIIPCMLCCVQGRILLSIAKKHGATTTSQQEFWAQIKSLCFVLVMLLFFVPYQIFRMYYLSYPTVESQNEIFLALTALSCVDLLTFVGRCSCSWSRTIIF